MAQWTSLAQMQVGGVTQQKRWGVALDSLTGYNFGTPEIPSLAEIVTLG